MKKPKAEGASSVPNTNSDTSKSIESPNPLKHFGPRNTTFVGAPAMQLDDSTINPLLQTKTLQSVDMDDEESAGEV